MQKLLVLASILATAAVAHAEPTAYVSTGAQLGGDAGIDLALNAEAGYRLSDVLWLHGQLTRGNAGDDEGGGPLTQARAGVEARTCSTSGMLCAVAGIDLGMQRYTWAGNDAAMERHDDTILAPRVGLDAW